MDCMCNVSDLYDYIEASTMSPKRNRCVKYLHNTTVNMQFKKCRTSDGLVIPKVVLFKLVLE